MIQIDILDDLSEENTENKENTENTENTTENIKNTTSIRKLSSNSIISKSSKSSKSSNSAKLFEKIFITNWIINEVSYKFGIAFRFSNNSTGVIFKDNTQIIMENNSNNSTTIKLIENNIITNYKLYEYPSNLSEKITLVHYFKDYFNKLLKINKVINEDVDEDTNNDDYYKYCDYVLNWYTNKQVILFILTNDIHQVCFLKDKSQIILSLKLDLVIYVCKNSERRIYRLSKVAKSKNYDMLLRLKYSKDIIEFYKSKNVN